MKSRKMKIRKALAFVLFVAGIVWSIAFPKKASFDHDMVASVCIGAGLLGSATLLFLWHRMRPASAVLSFLLLWSLVGNAYWIAWSGDAADALLPMTELERAPDRPVAEPGPPPDNR